jgi:phytanoyl-CoA hydroxylase
MDMLTEAQVAEFGRNGFLNGGKVIGDDALDELTAALDAVLEKGPEGFGQGERQPVSFRDLTSGSGHPVWQIVNIWEATDAFERLIYHPQVVEGISQLTGEDDLMVWHDQIQYKPAEYGGATTWHQDAPLWPIIKPMTPVSAWIPFDDADEENGCMWMVPGSHKWGNQIEFLRTQGELKQREDFKNLTAFQPPADAETTAVEAVPWPVKRGEVSFHHSLTWHGSPFNRSGRPRRAIAIHYMTGEARFEAGGQHIMKQFVDLPDGAPMAEAGAHFPRVCNGGKAVGVPERLAAG